MPEQPVNSENSDNPEMEVAVLSEAGLREENQDWMSWSRIPWGECYIVADGMGGYKGGATASRMTVEGLERRLKAQSPELPFEQALQEAARKTNEEVHRAAQSGNPEMNQMGSTVAVALISRNQLQVGHIGDSRVYLFRKGTLKPLTTDHTSVQRMVNAGMITPKQAREHPEGHILSRAVGSKADVDIEIAGPIELEDGDGVLLCSDGLSGYVDDKQIEKIVAHQSDVQRIPRQLVDLALQSGGDDNITVQFVRYGKSAERQRHTATFVTPAPAENADRVREFFRGLPSNRPAWVAALAVVITFALPPVRDAVWRGSRGGVGNSASSSQAQSAAANPPAAAPTQPVTSAPAGTADASKPVAERVATASAKAPAPPPVAAAKEGNARSSSGDYPPSPAPLNSRRAAVTTGASPTPAPSSAAAPVIPTSESPAAPQAPVPPPKIRVVILARGAEEQAQAAMLQEALAASSEFQPELRTDDLGDPPPDKFIFHSEDSEESARRLQKFLQEKTKFKDWKWGAYQGERIEQYQKKVERQQGERHLLIVVPDQNP